MNPLAYIDPDDPYPESDGQPMAENTQQYDSVKEMADKLAFYDLYGVEEYYVYDPAENTLRIWLRQGERLTPLSHVGGWTSPRLAVRFALMPTTLAIFDPAGRPFLTSVERARRAELEHQRAERLAARLRDLGLDPDLDD